MSYRKCTLCSSDDLEVAIHSTLEHNYCYYNYYVHVCTCVNKHASLIVCAHVCV